MVNLMLMVLLYLYLNFSIYNHHMKIPKNLMKKIKYTPNTIKLNLFF